MLDTSSEAVSVPRTASALQMNQRREVAEVLRLIDSNWAINFRFRRTSVQIGIKPTLSIKPRLEVSRATIPAPRATIVSACTWVTGIECVFRSRNNNSFERELTIDIRKWVTSYIYHAVSDFDARIPLRYDRPSHGVSVLHRNGRAQQSIADSASSFRQTCLQVRKMHVAAVSKMAATANSLLP